jgi:uncharacterized repeat protein (TIGR03803 family)
MSAAAATAQTDKVLHTYPGTTSNNSGILPPGSMSQGPDGALYTANYSNGANNSGSVFKMTTAGQLTPLYNYCSHTSCTDGASPLGGLTLGFNRDLYGTTKIGGTGAAGTAFKVTTSGALTTLHNFANLADDSVPTFPLLQSQDGNLYGVSNGEYTTQFGAIYRISHAPPYN